MSPLKHSRNVAARMGRWSASHRKTAIFGWLAFVVAAFAVGMAIPTQKIDEAEFVLVQSDTRTVDDPAFRAVIGDAVARLRRFDEVEKLRSPLVTGNEG